MHHYSHLNKTSLIALVFVLCSSFQLLSQEKYTISGYIKDAQDGEDLIGVNVYVQELQKGTSSNFYGFYSLTLTEGTYQIGFSYLGYEDVVYQVSLFEDKRINIELSTGSIQTEEVIITAERRDRNVESAEMGTVELETEDIKVLPALLGEVDIMRTIQLLPGVQTAGEGNSGFYVRGGGPDQNLVLLDHAVVYNPGHLFGFFSVFNADAIKNTVLVKGGMPAYYGGRVSSVIDVSMKEGNTKEKNALGGIGLISSRLTVTEPIHGGKGAWTVSGRRTYIDVLTKPILNNVRDGEFGGNSYYFFDVNAKANYRFGDKDRLFASGYFGRDVFTFNDPDGAFNINIPWGNTTATLRWNHLFNDKLFMNAIAVYNNYVFEISSEFQDIPFTLNSGIRDFGSKIAFDYFPAVSHEIKFGVEHTYHIFTPYIAEGQSDDVEFTTDLVSKKRAHETALYIQDEFDAFDWLKLNIGIRGSMFNFVGPFEKTVFDENGNAADTLSFGRSEHIKTYLGLEPRINARFKLTSSSSIKASFTINNQYIHLASPSASTLPIDLWVPSTDRTKPQIGYQYALGYFQNFKDNVYETSVEVYYKDLKNQIEFGENQVPAIETDVEDNFVYGTGRSYGAEFFVKKARGDLTGWIGYTLSWTDRSFPDIDEGHRFPAKYDRRHDLSAIVSYQINDKWNIASTFVYGTGQSTTVPLSRYLIEGKVAIDWSDRNAYRLAPYHRMDIAATCVLRDDEKRYSAITISVYNLYNRKNPYFIYGDISGDISDIANGGNIINSAKQVSLFPVLPSVTWNFKL